MINLPKDKYLVSTAVQVPSFSGMLPQRGRCFWRDWHDHGLYALIYASGMLGSDTAIYGTHSVDSGNSWESPQKLFNAANWTLYPNFDTWLDHSGIFHFHYRHNQNYRYKSAIFSAESGFSDISDNRLNDFHYKSPGTERGGTEIGTVHCGIVRETGGGQYVCLVNKAESASSDWEGFPQGMSTTPKGDDIVHTLFDFAADTDDGGITAKLEKYGRAPVDTADYGFKWRQGPSGGMPICMLGKGGYTEFAWWSHNSEPDVEAVAYKSRWRMDSREGGSWISVSGGIEYTAQDDPPSWLVSTSIGHPSGAPIDDGGTYGSSPFAAIPLKGHNFGESDYIYNRIQRNNKTNGIFGHGRTAIPDDSKLDKYIDIDFDSYWLNSDQKRLSVLREELKSSIPKIINKSLFYDDTGTTFGLNEDTSASGANEIYNADYDTEFKIFNARFAHKPSITQSNTKQDELNNPNLFVVDTIVGDDDPFSSPSGQLLIFNRNQNPRYKANVLDSDDFKNEFALPSFDVQYLEEEEDFVVLSSKNVIGTGILLDNRSNTHTLIGASSDTPHIIFDFKKPTHISKVEWVPDIGRQFTGDAIYFSNSSSGPWIKAASNDNHGWPLDERPIIFDVDREITSLQGKDERTITPYYTRFAKMEFAGGGGGIDYDGYELRFYARPPRTIGPIDEYSSPSGKSVSKRTWSTAAPVGTEKFDKLPEFRSPNTPVFEEPSYYKCPPHNDWFRPYGWTNKSDLVFGDNAENDWHWAAWEGTIPPDQRYNSDLWNTDVGQDDEYAIGMQKNMVNWDDTTVTGSGSTETSVYVEPSMEPNGRTFSFDYRGSALDNKARFDFVVKNDQTPGTGHRLISEQLKNITTWNTFNYTLPTGLTRLRWSGYVTDTTSNPTGVNENIWVDNIVGLDGAPQPSIFGYIGSRFERNSSISGFALGGKHINTTISGFALGGKHPNTQINSIVIGDTERVDSINAYMIAPAEIIVNAYMDGRGDTLDDNSYIINGFLRTPDINASGDVGGLMTGRGDLLNSKINARMGTAAETAMINAYLRSHAAGKINAYIKTPLDDQDSKVNAYAPSFFPNSTINAFMGFTQYDPYGYGMEWGDIYAGPSGSGNLFNPGSIGGFKPGQQNVIFAFMDATHGTQFINGYIKMPNPENSKINAVMDSTATQSGVINAFVEADLNANSQINAYTSGIGFKTTEIIGLMPAASGTSSSKINSYTIGVKLSDSDIFGYMVSKASGTCTDHGGFPLATVDSGVKPSTSCNWLN